MAAPRVPVPDPRLVEVLRTDLLAAGYTVDGLADVLGPVAGAALARDQAVAARAVLSRSAEPAAVLARLFVLGDVVRADEVAAALAATGVAGARGAGLVEASGGEVRALVDLRPYAAVDAAGDAEWWVASDLGSFATGQPVQPDHVLGVGGASTTLAQLAVRRRVARVLDVGTGSGVQALHATRHASAVTATDVSVRALGFTAFNAALADVDVDLRLGSLLEPVTGSRFDLVVSNPPFVVTPRTGRVPGYEYRDGGLPGDEVVRRLVTDVAAVLEPGGVAQLLGNWEHHPGTPWQERVGRWLDASGLDGWVVQRQVSDPAEYAETWVRDGGLPPGPRFDAMVEAWLDDFAARGVEAVGFGYLTLRRPLRGRPTLRRVEEHEGSVHQPLGEHLARCLEHHDLLVALDDDGVLARRWTVAPDVTEERHHVPGSAEPSAVLLRQNSGFGRAVNVSAVLAGAVGACDGELSLGAVVAAVAAVLGLPEGDVRAEVVGGVRDLATDDLIRPS